MKNLVGVYLMVFALASISCISASAQKHKTAAVPGKRTLLFTSSRDGMANIYTIFEDGSRLKKLTSKSANFSASWSPDGRQIAWNSHRDGGWRIWIMNADGTNKRKLTRGSSAGFNYEYHPHWSPDGTQIVYEKWDDASSNFEIQLAKKDGTGIRNLSNNKAHDRLPSWSPKGNRIAYYSNRDGNDEIYIFDIAKSETIRLTHDKSTDYAPSWNSDGSRILFHSDRGGKFRTYTMKPDGSGVKILSFVLASDHKQGWDPRGSNSKTTPYHSLRNGNSAWSKDGKRMAFHSFVDGNKEIYLMDADGKNRTRLTNHKKDDWFPAWRPKR